MVIKLSHVHFALILIETCMIAVNGQLFNYTMVRHVYMTSVLKHIGDGSNITVEDIKAFYSSHKLTWRGVQREPVSDCLASPDLDLCLLKMCLSPDEVHELSGLSHDTNDKEVSTISMMLLHLLESKSCIHNVDTHQNTDHPGNEPPSSAETWGYGLLCTSIIVLAALGGFLALPFVYGLNYKRVLIYMVGLAVGTLAGSSLFFLAPEALELTDQEMNEHNYVWKCLVMVAAIYSFFIIERVLKMITSWRERKKRNPLQKLDSGISVISLPIDAKNKIPNYTDLDTVPHVESCTNNVSRDSGIDNVAENREKDTTDIDSTIVTADVMGTFSTDVAEQGKKHIAPVAWMIIFGDAIHNFIDGVSIGAAFTESVLTGVSVSVAIFCEELPHELGDFAVLLSGGMSKKRAVISNFLSACTIYIGMVVGVFLGENETAHTWVFAFAGGMFLYIALVDMMPEMCASGEREENRELIGNGIIFLLQNLGMLSGFGIMLILAIYGGNLEEAITGRS